MESGASVPTQGRDYRLGNPNAGDKEERQVIASGYEMWDHIDQRCMGSPRRVRASRDHPKHSHLGNYDGTCRGRRLVGGRSREQLHEGAAPIVNRSTRFLGGAGGRPWTQRSPGNAEEATW